MLKVLVHNMKEFKYHENVKSFLLLRVWHPELDVWLRLSELERVEFCISLSCFSESCPHLRFIADSKFYMGTAEPLLKFLTPKTTAMSVEMSENFPHFLNISIFSDIMSCLLKVNRCFGGTCSLHLQVVRVCQAKNKHEPGCKQSSEANFVLVSIFVRFVKAISCGNL
jgi:hypothetical protein